MGKILEDDSIQVNPTTVRVPVVYSHSEAVNVETEKELTPSEAREVLENFPGIKIVDDPAKKQYPLAIDSAGQDAVLVGRIRKDISQPNALNFWVVADNLRKGAALNTVQIAEELIKTHMKKAA